MPDQVDTLIHALKSAGFRLTPQRIAICNLLVESKQHPTANEIYEDLRPKYPSLSLATVYNTVETLIGLGVINALGSAGDSAVHYDANISPHINLACIVCHRVVDIESQSVQIMDQEVARRSGYQIKGARVLYYGLCPDCQSKVV